MKPSLSLSFILFNLILLCSINAQVQMGIDIDGEFADDLSGEAVSLSADGTILAVGARWNDGNGNKSGHVRIYQWNSNTWIQMGNDIDGESSDDESGRSVSLSADGTTLAIGAKENDGNGSSSGHVRIYQWDGNIWIQMGHDIDGEFLDDRSGDAVSLSADGTTLAIGAKENDGNGSSSGHVRIYQWDGNAWLQMGMDINGEASFDDSGSSVSISADGTILAIGADLNDGNGSNSGHVRIYQWNGNNWMQMGNDIDAEANDDRSGKSVSLNSDGTSIAIGAHFNHGNGFHSGHVRVYQWNGNTWLQVGNDIDGEASSDISGGSVSLSSDGTILAIGAIWNNGNNGSSSGHVRVYQWNGNTWLQVGNDIDGESGSNRFGNSVSLNANGTTLAIGAPWNDGNGSFSGHVRVFDLVGVIGCSDIYEPNNSLTNADASAFPILNYDNVSHTIDNPTIHENGEKDFYKIDHHNDGVLTVRLDNLTANYNLRIWKDGQVYKLSSNSGTNQEFIQMSLDGDSDVYIQVYGVSGANSCTPYRLSIDWIPPLIKTDWHQGSPYKDMCPYWQLGAVTHQAPAGCGAIAVSQICRYYNWPLNPAGVVDYPIQELAFPFNQDVDEDLNPVIFDYNAISNSSNSEIAELVYLSGAVIEQNFNRKSSGTSSLDVIGIGMIDHFAYANQMYIVDRNSLTKENFLDFIKNEIDVKRPVILWADDVNSDAAHLMIIDGYNAYTDEVHINMGWRNPASNKYYDLDNIVGLNPDGTLHEHNYNDNQKILIGIYPFDQTYVFPPMYATPEVMPPVTKSSNTCPILILPEPNQTYPSDNIDLLWADDGTTTGYLLSVEALGNNIIYYDSISTYAGLSYFESEDLLPINDSIAVTILPIDVNGNVTSCPSQLFYTNSFECDLIINSIDATCVSNTTFDFQVDFSGVSGHNYNLYISDSVGIADSIIGVSEGTYTIGPFSNTTNYGVTVRDQANIDNCVAFDMISSPQCITCPSLSISIDTIVCNGSTMDMVIDLSHTSSDLIDLYTNHFGVNEHLGVTSGLYTFNDIPFDSDLFIVAENVNNPSLCKEVIHYGNVDCGVCNVDCELKIQPDQNLYAEFYGSSISSFENNLVVGAPNGGTTELGRVFLYDVESCEYNPTILQSSDISILDGFGSSVDISEDRIIVGSFRNDAIGNDAGALYIFDWDGTSWIETKITASDGMALDFFGSSCALEDNIFVVGAPLEDNSNGNNAGSIYIYEWDGSVWNETKLISSDGTAGLTFGSEVEILNGKVYVSAPSGYGSVYIYEWDGTIWSETKLTASDAAGGDNFGTGLAVDNNRILVGARGDDDNGNLSGSAYVFDLIGNTWVETKILPSDGQQSDEFGRQVDLLSDKLLIGAAFDDDYGNLSGSVYLFEWNGATWDESKFYSSDISAGDRFGTKVHIDSNYIYVNARFSPAGAVYLYDQNPDLYYLDNDSDGYGHNSLSISACFQPQGYVSNNLDCNDNNPNINPLISEVCDSIDNNCDGLFDEGYICCDNGLLINNYVGSSDNWFDASNWSLNVVPNICHHVIIPNGKTVRILHGQTGFCYTVEVISGGLLDVKNGAVLQVVAPNN